MEHLRVGTLNLPLMWDVGPQLLRDKEHSSMDSGGDWDVIVSFELVKS